MNNQFMLANRNLGCPHRVSAPFSEIILLFYFSADRVVEQSTAHWQLAQT